MSEKAALPKSIDQSHVLETSFRLSLTAANSKLSTTDQKFINLKKDDGAAVALLHHTIVTTGVTVPMQDFTNKIIQHCIVNKRSELTVSLKQLDGKPLRFKRIKTTRALRVTAKARSRMMWTKN